VTIGRTDFKASDLLENYAALVDELIRAKPAAAKGRYLRTITLATTMGPGVRVDPQRTRDIIEEIKEEEEPGAVAEAAALA
jgi:large subunit ribosomal protein L1